MKTEITYKIYTYSPSDKFFIFRVIGDCIWQMITQKAYYIDDDLEWDYFDFQFDDPVTAEIICDMLNEEENKEYNMNLKEAEQ